MKESGYHLIAREQFCIRENSEPTRTRKVTEEDAQLLKTRRRIEDIEEDINICHLFELS